MDRLGFFVGAVVLALLFIQWRWPLRRQHFSALKRILRNALLAAPSFLISRALLLPASLLVSIWARDHHFGLFNWFHLPLVLAIVAGVLIYDYAYYWWHQLMHLAQIFWRFHNVHHTDLDMDVSTASRFHFGEVVVSLFFRGAIVALFGFNLWTLAVYEAVFSLATQFHHSNWRLPIGLERVLNYVLVTPRMHGAHHSIVERETNSNWGTVFSWWDRLHGTLRVDVPQDAITIGVAAYRSESDLTFWKLLLLPFQKQRAWRLPDGTVPERAPREAKELVP